VFRSSGTGSYVIESGQVVFALSLPVMAQSTTESTTTQEPQPAQTQNTTTTTSQEPAAMPAAQTTKTTDTATKYNRHDKVKQTDITTTASTPSPSL
jgi:hypothetical protein